MKLSEVIKKYQKTLLEKGDLECFSSHYFEDISLKLEKNEGQFDKNWNMPKKFYVLGDSD